MRKRRVRLFGRGGSNRANRVTKAEEKEVVQVCLNLLPREGKEMFLAEFGGIARQLPGFSSILKRHGNFQKFLKNHADAFKLRQDGASTVMVSALAAAQGKALRKKFFQTPTASPSEASPSEASPSEASSSEASSRQIDFERVRRVAVVVEGDLRRTGRITRVLVKADGIDNPQVYDMFEGGKPDAYYMEKCGLRYLFESSIIKVMHDCAVASEVLQHYHGIKLDYVADTQALWNAVDHGNMQDLSADEMIVELGASAPEATAGDYKKQVAIEKLRALMELEETGDQQPTWEIRPVPEALDVQSRWHLNHLISSCDTLLEKLPPMAIREVKDDFARRMDVLRSRTSSGIDSLRAGEQSPYAIEAGFLELTEPSSGSPRSIMNVESTGDDENAFLACFEDSDREIVKQHPGFKTAVELVLDFGRRPILRHRQDVESDEGRSELSNLYLDSELGLPVVDEVFLSQVTARLQGFDSKNRAVIPGSLHRASAMRMGDGSLCGVTLRFGRHVSGCTAPLDDLLGGSVLLIGGPGVGKTTLLRECAARISEQQRVMIVDRSNEIAGDSRTPHRSVGMARRLMVQDEADGQKLAMLEALENHTPQFIVVDEISNAAEAFVARTIARRGVRLVATCHGRSLRDLRQNSELSSLLGGFREVTLGAAEKRYDGKKKTATERIAPPLFDTIIEVQSQNSWVIHRNPAQSVDDIIAGGRPKAERRWRDHDGRFWIEVQAA